MHQPKQITDTYRHKIITLLAYSLVAVLIIAGWRNAELELFHAKEGIGYWFGIIGTTLMALLFLYPLRKRWRRLRGAGAVRHWFRVHMIFGVVGPVFVIFHSNFDLGSLNSRIALFCTLTVTLSGVFGRYIYGHLHYGMYGRRASLESLRYDIEQVRESQTQSHGLRLLIDDELRSWEEGVLTAQPGTAGALLLALTTSISAPLRLQKVRRKISRHLESKTGGHRELHRHKASLQSSAARYARQRTTLLRKFAQLRVFERLFSLWHIVHYPLFLLLVPAVIVHITAVHMY